MKIAVASDHRGFEAKNQILSHVAEYHHEVRDFGTFTSAVCDYPDFASKAAQAVSNGDADRAILISGTGIGMCIVANKFNGIRAALCQDEFSAELSRRQYDANVLCMSTDLLGKRLAAPMIKLWLRTPFDEVRHARRIAKISQYEQAVRLPKNS